MYIILNGKGCLTGSGLQRYSLVSANVTGLFFFNKTLLLVSRAFLFVLLLLYPSCSRREKEDYIKGELMGGSPRDVIIFIVGCALQHNNTR